MSLFNFYDLPYESAVKILQKVDFPTTVNFYKASTYYNSIIEANCSLKKMEEEEKEEVKRKMEYLFERLSMDSKIFYGGHSGRSTFTNSFVKYLSPWMRYEECPISSIEEVMLPSFSSFRTVSSEEIEKKANEKNKTLIKEKKKTRKAVKERPVKHQFRHMNPRGKSFNFHQ